MTDTVITFGLSAMLTLLIPEGVNTLELSNSIVWFQDDILYSKPRGEVYEQLSRKQMEEEFVKLRDFVEGRKVFMLAESHPRAESPRKEDRDFIAEKLNEIIKAIAIITPNALSRMILNLFFLFKPPLYPTKMFVNVLDAKKWLDSQKYRGAA